MPLLLIWNKFSLFKTIILLFTVCCTEGANTCSKAVLKTLEKCNGALLRK